MESRCLTAISPLVRDYDEAIDYYCRRLGFELVEDTRLSASKRWVRVRPSAATAGSAVLLAKAKNERERAAVGNQSGGRVFLFGNR